MKKTAFVLLVTCSLFNLRAGAQQLQWTNISLDNLSAFNAPGKNWTIAADAQTDYLQATAIKPIAGTGALINNTGKANNTQLITNSQFGDMEIELEFMMAKGSNSGVYLQGRYEVQLADSWMKLNPAFSDCGGIYQRWIDAEARGYDGVAPIMNVAKAPGLWQKLSIKFYAPKFNDKGEKIQNAYFGSVYLNGVLVQQQVAVTGPTRSAYLNDEKPTGPLVLQGDHGNVAFRNIRYRTAAPAVATNGKSAPNPITISADGKPYLLRSFLNFDRKKLTHVISAGYPDQVNYSYNLKQGAIIQIWRGQFLDVTDMWHQRGEPQLAKPLGSVMPLSNAPALAVLTNADAAWPDSVAFDDFHNKGYVLDANRFASYEYDFNGINVIDKISTPQATGLTREITVVNAPNNLYCRIASAGKIADMGKGLYAINDKAYYIQTGTNGKATLRQTPGGAELLLPVKKDVASTYSIIW